MAFHRYAASVNDLNAHITNTLGAHDASAISTSVEIGGSTYTNVYEAISALAAGGANIDAPDASSSVKGILKLTKHLSGTADLPKVVDFELTDQAYDELQTLGSLAYYYYDGYDIDTMTQLYGWRSLPGPGVDGYYLGYVGETNSPTWLPTSDLGGGGTVVDATSSTKGILKLTNHLSGTADLPKVVDFELTNYPDNAATSIGSIAYYNQDGYEDDMVTPKYGWRSFKPSTYGSALISIGFATGVAWSDLLGDVTGPITSSVVGRINGTSVPAGGSLTTGNILRVSGSSAMTYGALDLSNSNSVTNVLAVANLPSATTGAKGVVQLAGDIAGTSTAVTVAKVNGTTVPAGGSLTTGNILRVSGSSAMTYGALDLTNANSITGILPVANAPSATTGAKGVVQLTGDLGGTSTSPTVVDLTIPSEAVGQVLFFNGTNWRGLTAGTEGYVLTAHGAASPTWMNSISKMTNIASEKYTLRKDATASYNATTEVFYKQTVSSATPSLAASVTLAASTGITLTVNATICDAYTGYGEAKRVSNIVKAGKFFRGSTGGAIRTGFSTDQDITPPFGDLHAYDLTFTLSGNDVQINVIGDASLTSNWTITVNVSYGVTP